MTDIRTEFRINIRCLEFVNLSEVLLLCRHLAMSACRPFGSIDKFGNQNADKYSGFGIIVRSLRADETR